MPPPTSSSSEIWSASLLRRDLNTRAHQFAHAQKLLHEIAPGPHQDTDPHIIFGRSELGPHGNFHPASDLAISTNPAWLRRLAKPHTSSRRSRARNDWPWRELDAAVSSDALLMNIFCHPRVFNGRTLAPAVANLLNVDRAVQPRFGINPRVPLRTTRKSRSKLPSELSGRANLLTDRTEIDLQLGNLFLEAKLTESNFQTAAPRLIERYRDLETIFDVTRLPRKILYTPATHPPVEDYSQLEPEFELEAAADISNEAPIIDVAMPNEAPIFNVVIPSEAQSAKSRNPRISPKAPPTSIETQAPANYPQSTSPQRTVIQGYQLIRNVFAAYASDASFCVLCDARRRDLIETWYTILSAVHHPTFTTRLKLLTWQELSTALPQDLQQFLHAKYGIAPT
jgi:hypothetical protein